MHVNDPTPLMCSDGICNIEINGRSLYKDENYLSDSGSARLSPLFTPVLLGANQN